MKNYFKFITQHTCHLLFILWVLLLISCSKSETSATKIFAAVITSTTSYNKATGVVTVTRTVTNASG